MYVAANPAKARSAVDKKEMQAKYLPGHQVLPKVHIRERTAEERRADEEDRRLIDDVREMSLREAVPGAQPQPEARRRHRQSANGRSTSNRNQSSDSHRRATGDTAGSFHGHDSSRQGSDQSASDRPERRRRRHRSASRQRQVEHQSSLRSLIGSSNMSERDIEREIEDFARQIQEEGLLDGLDLDNIDLTRDDDLSRRITEAYRRRQRERSRNESSQRPASNSSNAVSRSSETPRTDARLRAPESGSRSRASSRPTTNGNGSGQSEDRSRRPPTGATNLEVRDPTGRPRRRTASGGRSATTPVFSSTAATRPAARSSTDLGLRSQTTSAFAAPRHSFSEGRISSTPSIPAASSQAPSELPTSASGNIASFASRVPQWNPNVAASPPATTREPTAAHINRPHLPAELAIVHSAVSSPMSSPSATSDHRRTRSQLFPEPSISCSRCNKQHIEYKVHYNCGICAGGQWNICLDCYRSGKGCQYWFGFGYGAWKKWESRRQKGEESLARPHMLTACRYLPPSSTPGGADGRKTLTTDDPRGRQETGTFCARCFAWTNDCYWRCDVCNEGDWGFCNNCVNQGKSCTHPLLPLTHEALQATGRPHSPRSPGRPPTAVVYTGPQAASIGPFKPLTFRTRCDVCQDPISPSHVRYHCFSCQSVLIPDAPQGDYDVCSSCYNSLVSRGQISMENGHSAWRRCLNGHRMAVIGFTDGKVGQWRFTERDVVGGRLLHTEAFESTEYHEQELQKWSWKNGDERLERLATKDVSATAPAAVGSMSFTQTFPPDGGTGRRANALWAWYPQAGSEDELLFPKGAEIREIEDVNGDWFFGTYMGAEGLFPAPYVRLEQRT
ncbi:Src-domain containing protein [Metarhizium rileyi]|uniref:Src-domain containing protein n=1 Tax=Metarhizium rileyi (strain RCEF 4871) TaxID=1649241 RepID=A0A166ZQA7_METRR|nr:Src-domain containing protein [Metarhizium rileyi RCEF 4871]